MTEPSTLGEGKKRYQPNNIYRNPLSDRSSQTTSSNGLVIQHLKHRGRNHASYSPQDSDPYYFVYNLYNMFCFDEEKPVNPSTFKILPLLKLKNPQEYCLLSFRQTSAAHICSLLQYFRIDFHGGMSLNPSHIKTVILAHTEHFIEEAALKERKRRRLRDKSRITPNHQEFMHWDTERLRNIENGSYMQLFEEHLIENGRTTLNEYEIAVYLKSININLLVVYENRKCRIISTIPSTPDEWVVLYKKKNEFELFARYTSPGRCSIIMNDKEFTDFAINILFNENILDNGKQYIEASTNLLAIHPEDTILDQLDEIYEDD
tara:strand:+ start:3035 stop:3991 length:957 start_codon:yes stop_codon:yes gene_type:complete